MSAYMMEIAKEKCRCGKRASYNVFNTFNTCVGAFCRQCAARKVAELDRNATKST